MKEKSIVLKKIDPRDLYGIHDANLKLLSDLFGLQLIARGNVLKLIGNSVAIEEAHEAIVELVQMLRKNKELSADDIIKVFHIIHDEMEFNLKDSSMEEDAKRSPAGKTIGNDIILSTPRGMIKVRTEGQRKLVKACHDNDVVFAVGPAGTGKTYLAVAMAIAALRNKEVLKIVLARPAVEAGENLGFLPGDLKEKIDPYLKPLYDALKEMLPAELLKRYFEQDIIEIIPLAYMRGRTLNNAFIILDEAQNATKVQMKMILTRLGVNSKMIINGDITQIDLPNKKYSGLVDSIKILKDISGISIVKLGKKDVVRHKLVQDIILAYEKSENNKSK